MQSFFKRLNSFNINSLVHTELFDGSKILLLEFSTSLHLKAGIEQYVP